MKAATIFRLAIAVFLILSLAAFPAFPPPNALAQSGGYPEPFERYSREELAQMLAPIALYPDALLSQVLMAATYPIEVIEADRWVKRNPDLKGDALDDALLTLGWDPSVKAVCHFPSVLALMSERIGETTEIGNAFLAQEDEVLDMIQDLRTRAYAHGKLTTTPEQKIVVERETIIIEPATPRVVYVPYYDPLHVYGPWWYPAYPPYYWGPPARVSIGVGVSFWPGFYFGFVSWPWSYFDWHFRYIYIDVHKRPRYVRHDRWVSYSGRWNHVPSHRRGVAYRDIPTARKYGQYPSRLRDFRQDTRGFPEPRLRDRDRRFGSRTTIDRDARVVTRPRAQSLTQERPRIEARRQEATRIERPARERPVVESATQERPRIETRRQEATRIERPVREQSVARPATRERPRIEARRQEATRIERPVREQPVALPARQEPPVVERDRRTDRTARGTPARQLTDREQQQRSRDNIFNRVEDGIRESQSSRRGQSSRYGSSLDDRGRGRR